MWTFSTTFPPLNATGDPSSRLISTSISSLSRSRRGDVLDIVKGLIVYPGIFPFTLHGCQRIDGDDAEKLRARVHNPPVSHQVTVDPEGGMSPGYVRVSARPTHPLQQRLSIPKAQHLAEVV